ncbi:TMEM175 family protein [Paludibacterium yongneupense]|uniref:TMEM175 family protein n=1 Tax=Paludibacterium yongneupense TaxID=400061 RepID=UPI001FEA1A55|nr:TMEM175 family protein [Paludibacterium yongneupense]
MRRATHAMGKNRLEAFSDGVLAIIITIMVLELKVPHGASPAVLAPLWPVFLSYILSFVYVGIYWNNHHHLMQAVESVSGSILWANLLLLFCLSLLPFTTGWVGENHFARWPTVLYGVNLLLCAQAYFILQNRLIRHHGRDSVLARAISRDVKGKVSLGLYLAGIAAAWLWEPLAGLACIVAVAMLWLVPDRRVERALSLKMDD